MAGRSGKYRPWKIYSAGTVQFISSFIVVELLRDSIRGTIIVLDLLFRKGSSVRTLCVLNIFGCPLVNFSQCRQLETGSWLVIDENSR